MSVVVLSRLSDKNERERGKGREMAGEREGEGGSEERRERKGRWRENEREDGARASAIARARSREGREEGIVVVSSLQCIAFTIPRVPVTPRAPTNRVRRASHEEIHETSFAVERFGSSRFIERKSFCMRDNEHKSIDEVCVSRHTQGIPHPMD